MDGPARQCTIYGREVVLPGVTIIDRSGDLLEDARVRDLSVVPLCPCVAGFIRKYQEYLPLVAPGFNAHVLER